MSFNRAKSMDRKSAQHHKVPLSSNRSLSDLTKIRHSLTTATNKKDIPSSSRSSTTADPFHRSIKGSKYTAPNDLKLKIKVSKGSEDDPIIKSPEFQLLYKIFVPTKYLIKNDKFSIRQLLNHLPTIIPGDADSSNNELNFQVHLFLSSVMTNYVTSWYLNKLNTDNMEFVQSTYQIMCDFVKDLGKRIKLALKKANIVQLIDQISEILNDHLVNFVSDVKDIHNIKFVSEYLKNCQANNTINDNVKDTDISKIIKEFLSNSHVIFYESENEGGHEHVKEADFSQLTYFRILAKKIVATTFQSSENELLTGPINSKISMNLIVIIVGDLIFSKIFDQLSSPEFILDTVMNNITDMIAKNLETNINSTQTEKLKEESISVKDKIKSLLNKTYKTISYLIVNLSTPSMVIANDNENILENSVFALINTITNFSNRKPLLYSIIKVIKTCILTNDSISNKIDSIGKHYISNMILESSFLSDANLSKTILSLRESLFHNTNQGEPSAQKEKVTIDQLTNKIFEIINIKIPNCLPVNQNLSRHFCYYHNESNDEFKKAIYKLLIIFNYNSNSSDNNLINELSDLNKLLVVRILDCIIANLYPEFVNT